MLGDTFSYKILLNKLSGSALFVHNRLRLDARFYRGLTLQLRCRWRHLWLIASQLRLALLRHRLRRWINHVLCLKLDSNWIFLWAKTTLSATWAWLSDGGCCEYWCCKSDCWITLGCCCCWYCCCCCSCCCCCWYCCCSGGTCCITFWGGCCWYCCWYCQTFSFINCNFYTHCLTCCWAFCCCCCWLICCCCWFICCCCWLNCCCSTKRRKMLQ